MKAKYIGTPGENGEFSAYGVEFEPGKFVDVPDKYALKFANNPYFETRGEEPDEPERSESVAALIDRIAAIEDLNALQAELDTETRVTGKTALEARIAALLAA